MGPLSAGGATFCHSLHAIFSTTFFHMWLSTVLVDSAFFSAEVSSFDPAEQTVYADCYGAMLVARRIGWDTLDACCCNPEDTWTSIKRKTQLYREADRDLEALADCRFSDNIFRRFLHMPPIDDIFPGLSDKPATLPGVPAVPVLPPNPVIPHPDGNINPPIHQIRE